MGEVVLRVEFASLGEALGAVESVFGVCVERQLSVVNREAFLRCYALAVDSPVVAGVRAGSMVETLGVLPEVGARFGVRVDVGGGVRVAVGRGGVVFVSYAEGSGYGEVLRGVLGVGAVAVSGGVGGMLVMRGEYGSLVSRLWDARGAGVLFGGEGCAFGGVELPVVGVSGMVRAAGVLDSFVREVSGLGVGGVVGFEWLLARPGVVREVFEWFGVELPGELGGVVPLDEWSLPPLFGEFDVSDVVEVLLRRV